MYIIVEDVKRSKVIDALTMFYTSLLTLMAMGDIDHIVQLKQGLLNILLTVLAMDFST